MMVQNGLDTVQMQILLEHCSVIIRKPDSDQYYCHDLKFSIVRNVKNFKWSLSAYLGPSLKLFSKWFLSCDSLGSVINLELSCKISCSNKIIPNIVSQHATMSHNICSMIYGQTPGEGTFPGHIYLVHFQQK